MHLSLLFIFLPFASASTSDPFSSLSVSPSLLPSIPTSIALSLPFSSPSSFDTTQPVSTSPSPSPSTLLSSPSTTSTTTSASIASSSFASSTPSSSSSSTAPTSSVTSTLSVQGAVAQPQSTSSPTSITVINGAAASSQDPSPSLVVVTSTFSTPSSTSTPSSSSGFFANTGAVAGTFTVVGLVGIAGVIGVILLIARRRRSRAYEEDTEFLDKSPDLSPDPPTTHITSLDDMSNSDHVHYGAPPMALSNPPAAYYPDHAYALHPQAFSQEAYPQPPSHGHPSPYPGASTRDYPAQHVYSPEDYDIAYPPPISRVDPNISHSHQFADVELDSAPAPPTQTALPNALRPSVNPAPSAPNQWAGTRFSVDSFYAGIATDTPPPPGRAL